MRDRLLQLTRLTAGYSLASFAGPLFTIVLTPLYTRVLRPADYAVLDTLTTLGILMLALGMLGLNGAASVYFHDGDAGHGARVVSTAVAVGLGWSLVVALLVAAAARPLARFSLGSEQQAGLLYLSAFALPFSVFYGIMQAGLRLRLQVKAANVLALMYLLLMAAFNVLLVLVLRWGVLGVQTANALTTLILAVTVAVMARWQWEPPLVRLAWPLVRSGVAFIPATLSFWALAYVDRLLLPAYAVALHERGLYAIANKLASTLALLVVPFQNAWGPLALSMRDDPDAPRVYARVMTLFLGVGLAAALALGLFAREILLVFTTRAYTAAAPYVGVLSYVGVASGATVAVGIGAYLARRTAALGWTTMLGAAVNVILNVLLIPRFGVWGAVWATAAGYVAVPVALYLAAQRIHPLPFELRKVLAALASQAVLLFAGLLVDTGSFWLDIALKLLLLAAYPAALLALGVIEAREARAVLDLLRSPRAAMARR